MLKIKKISPKTPLYVGAYFRHTGESNTDIRVYKCIAVSDKFKLITFAWYDPNKRKVEYAPNWCTIEKFNNFLIDGTYEVIGENDSEIHIQLKEYGNV